MKVIRLNAQLFPIEAYEAGVWHEVGIAPIEVEANTPDELIPHVADCDAVVVVSAALPTRVVESMTHCRVISRRGAGTDKIDVSTAKRMGILVTNVPDFCVEEQADHTLAMLLGLIRQLPRMQSRLQQGDYVSARRLSESNQRTIGKTLGLIGFGRSAQSTARRAHGFGMRVIATRQNMSRTAEADALGVKLVDLDTLLRESDYISLHTPLLEGTYHLIDHAAIDKMKHGALLINTSRGALIDEAALVDALRSGRLGGAGIDTYETIDVFADHPQPPTDHPLVKLLHDDINLILTSHVAAGSVQAMQDVSRGAVENVATVLQGRWPSQERIVNWGVVPHVSLRPPGS